MIPIDPDRYRRIDLTQALTFIPNGVADGGMWQFQCHIYLRPFY